MKQQIPNILTLLRLVLCLVMFAGFFLIYQVLNARGWIPGLNARYLSWITLGSFVLAAVTDFFDGYLARKWNVVSMFGAILDPIADKILVCGAIVGLVMVQQKLEGPFEGKLSAWVFISSALILFREFSVSAMREVLAPKGIKLPVTFLAKTKTTLQLVAIALLILFSFWPAFGIPEGDLPQLGANIAKWLFALAAAVTVWTGVEYALSAKKALDAG